MSNSDQRASSTSNGVGSEDEGDEQVREIHVLTPPTPPPPQNRARGSDSWEINSHRLSSSDSFTSENSTSMSREFNALLVAGSTIGNTGNENEGGNNNLGRIGEDDEVPQEEEETNPLAIVPDNSHPLDHVGGSSSSANINGGLTEEMSTHRVKREEIESKISAWQTAKIAKVNNRFKREDAVINGWKSEQVQKAESALKKVERKLEEKRARAIEEMQNEVAKAHRKAEERRASSEAKRGTKVAKIFEISNMLRAIGRAPTKRSFF
ncbi:remorin 4.1-like [Macadamia integrifolia]|uniref:remorin 4.1-like n=1 Tax=Macadamia integrifolia TaxID=60698 RepID=UPI001C4FD23E|nr:remorin 4.1-like [Macadamia integrifolia]